MKKNLHHIPKSYSKFGLTLLLMLFYLFNTDMVLAQSTANYTFSSATNGSLTDMSSGTTTLIAPTATTSDDASALTNIGFDFWFMGTRYTQYSVNCNGLMRLGGTVISTAFANDLNTGTNLPLLSAFWDDFGCASPIIAKIHYKVTGSAPNRVLTIEWKDFLLVWDATAGSASTFQVRLNEFTGKIEYVYGSMNNATTASVTTASIGFSTGNVNNTLLSVTDIATPAVTTATASVNDALVNNSTDGAITGLNSAADGSRVIYTFSQTAPTAPTGLTYTNIFTTSISLNWTDNAANELGYVVYTSTDGITYTFNQQLAAGSTSASVTGLVAGTLYYFKVYAVREGALSTALTGSQSTATAYTYSASGSIVIPCGVTSVVVETYGCGGGGGSSNNLATAGGSGGGGGAYAKGSHAVTPGSTYYYGVGIIGAGGPANSTTVPTAGGASWFNRTGVNGAPANSTDGTLAAGGRAGVNNSTATPNNNGLASSSYGNTTTADGFDGIGGTANVGGGGGNGANPGGGSGGADAATGDGAPGNAPGGGGAGGNDAAANKGGDGALGQVIIYYATGTPTITLGTNPTVCLGVTSANLPYTATSNSPNQYSLDFDAAANTAGFVDLGLTALPATPVVITVPGGAAAGIYNATITVKNSVTGCSSLATAFTVTIDASAAPAAASVITGSAYICKGQSGVAYSVPAITNATSYIWAYSGTGATITGATNNVTIDYNAVATSGNLTVYGTRICGNGTISANYAIGIMDVPAIITNPVSTSIGCNGTPVSFTVVTTGAGLTYQWQEFIAGWLNITNGGVYSGATTEILTISSPTGFTGRQYRCIVTGSCTPAVTSTAATLTVLATGLSGIKTVGTAGNYTTLKLAFDAINANGLTGNLELQIISSIADNTNAILNASSNCGNLNYTIKIYPTGVGPWTLSGSSATSLVTLNGADYVTFDGRLNQSGAANNLILSNTNTAGSTVKFIADATYNTVKYCTLKGVSTGFTTGVIWFSTATTTGNDFNTITYCDIRDGATTPAVGIYSLGTIAKVNDNNLVTYCNIYNQSKASNTSFGILFDEYCSKWTISNNSFYQTSNRTDVSYLPVYITSPGGDEFYIEDNYFGGQQPNCLGAPLSLTGSAITIQFIGIYLDVSTSGISRVKGNVMKNISWTGYPIAGFYIFAPVQALGRVDVIDNTIGDNATGSIALTINDNAAVSSSLTGLLKLGDGLLENNTIGSITISGTSNDPCYFNGIVILGTLTTDLLISNNTVGNSSTSNSIQTAAAATPEMCITGIYFGTAGTYNSTVSNNIIANISNNGTASSIYTHGISNKATGGAQRVIGNQIFNISSAGTSLLTNTYPVVCGIKNNNTTTGNFEINDNKIYSLSATANVAVNVHGILLSNATTGTNTVSRNFIHSINTTSNTAEQNGIYVYAGTATLSNNMIRLGLDKDGNSVSSSSLIRGIYKYSASVVNSYFNSVYIGGTVTAGAVNTFCYQRLQTAVDNSKNNIFYNARTGGTGKNYAIAINASTTFTSDYNDLFSSVAANLGSVTGGTTPLTYANWQAAIIAPKDASSINLDPKFLLPGGTSATVDLHLLDATSPDIGIGIAGTGITNDYDNQVRKTGVNPNGPCIGADERIAAPYGTNAYGIYLPEAQPTGTISDNQIVATGGTPGGIGILVGNPTTTNYTSVSLTTYPLITQDNIQCTNTNINFTTNSGTPAWMFGNNSSPSTAATSPATTTYTSTGRKDIIENVKVFKDFTNLSMATPSSGSILGAPAGAGCPTTYAYTSSVAGSPGFAYSWTATVPGGCTANIASPTVSTTNITFVNTTGVNQVFVLILNITSECCGPLTQVARYITIYPGPALPTVLGSPFTLCTGGEQTLSVNAPDASYAYAWYDASTGGTLLGNGDSYDIATAISGATSYYIQATNSFGCTSDRTEVIVNGNNTTAPTVPDNNTCGENQVTLEITGPVAGYSYNWYTGSCGGALVQSGLGTSYTTVLGATTTFYVSAVPPGCGSSTCSTPLITYIAPPATIVWLGVVAGLNNWFEPTNWTNSCLPTCATNVSIPNLAIDPDIGFSTKGAAACKDVDIQNGTILSFSDSKAELDICGNVLHDGTLTTNDLGLVQFMGSTDQDYYKTSGSGSFHNVKLNNTAGTPTLTLQNSDMVLGTGGIFTFQSGKLVTGDYKLEIYNTDTAAMSGYNSNMYVEGYLRRHINSAGTGTYDFPVGESTKGYQKAGINFTIAPSTLIHLTAKFNAWGGADPLPASGPAASECITTTYATAAPLNNGFWRIDASPADDYSGKYDMTLFNLAGSYSNGNNGWTIMSKHGAATSFGLLNADSSVSTCTGSVLTAVKRKNMKGFSDYATAQSTTALPIELLSFEAVYNGKSVDVNWITATEINNNYFTVERSTDAQNFEIIGTVPSKAPGGNSNQHLHYTLNDADVITGIYYYRLKQTDLNGTFKYSDIATVTIDDNGVFSIKPNPTTTSAEIMYSCFVSESAFIKVFDYRGRLVISKEILCNKGHNFTTIDLSDQPDGMFFVTLTAADKVYKTKLLKSK